MGTIRRHHKTCNHLRTISWRIEQTCENAGNGQSSIIDVEALDDVFHWTKTRPQAMDNRLMRERRQWTIPCCRC